MVQRTQVVMIDDLDDEELPPGEGQTVRFSVDDSVYEMDLSAKNAGKLRQALQPYVGKARRVGSARRLDIGSQSTGAGAGRSSTRAGKDQLAAMRDWARRNGYQVSDRGRVSKNIQDAFHAAQ